MAMRTPLLAVLGGMLGLALTACSSSAGNAQPEPPVQPTSTLSAGSVHLPAALPNLKTLLQKEATSGSATAGSFFGRRGQVWIDFSCLGDGTATVDFQPVGTVDIPCSGAAVNATKNQITFPGDHQISLRITAPTAVQWAVVVQQ
jgi:hypothetical protein